jgi:glutaredoxin
MKKTTLALVVCVLFGWSAFSQIYKWKDKDGNIIVSTTPPPPGVAWERKEIEKDRPGPETSAAVGANPTKQDSGFRRPYKDVKVLIYITDWCPVCRRARAFFKSLGVNLIEYDVEKDPAKEKERSRKAGGKKGVPLIDVEGTISLGFRADNIRATIEEKRASWVLR